MAYYEKTTKEIVGDYTQSVVYSGAAPVVTTISSPRFTIISQRTGTVTPGWYTKSKQRFVSYTRRNGSVKSYCYKSRKMTEQQQDNTEKFGDPPSEEKLRGTPFRLSTPENPFNFWSRVERWPFGHRIYTTANQRRVEFGDIGAGTTSYRCMPQSIPTADLLAQENLCVNKILLKIKDQKFNALQALAELEQTASLMGTTAVRLYGMFTNLKRGNLGGAAKALGVNVSKRAITRYGRKWSPGNTAKSIGDGVLELQYGWQPLLQDCYGAAEAVAQAKIQEVRNIARARSKRIYEPSNSTKSVVSYRDVNDTVTGRIHVETSMRIQFGLSSPALHSVSQLGFSNPAVIAWELLPWSFVIDWFIPFGNYLSSLDATSGLTFISGSKTVFMRQNMTRKVVVNYQKGVTPLGNWIGESEAWLTDVQVTRTKLTSFPSSRPPAFKNPAGLQHCVNAIALLTGFLKRSK